MTPALDETMMMDEIMRTWPPTIRVVLRNRMLCVGCPIAPFHTISDACREHGIDKSLFIEELVRAINAADAPS